MGMCAVEGGTRLLQLAPARRRSRSPGGSETWGQFKKIQEDRNGSQTDSVGY